MLANGVVSHTGSDGSSIGQRASDAGYAPYASLGEIIFWGSGFGNAPAAAASAWMNSPGHRANILNCALTDVGVAAPAVGDTMTAVTVFATP